MTTEKLTSGARFLLDWLAKEDWSQVGECKGSELDHLITSRLAEYGPAHPRGDDFRAVRLTEAGHAALQDQPPP